MWRVFLPFLCEIDVFLRQDGQDLVKDLVRVGLTGQSNVVLRLAGKTDTEKLWCALHSCVTQNRWRGVWLLYTLILRGPSRRARLLLGVSMVITLSRPRSREPNIFPPLFFFPLSPVTAMSKDRDLDRKHALTFNPFWRGNWSNCSYLNLQLDHSNVTLALCTIML